ncbi:hypothetical protein AVEN_62056-1 [Araneus ventricosus]|uniref:Uncharacterized protein n=1 Tax=Araneus ventricosus TaxID=182803 RepID=A0A4Y2I1C5_ARAVE|nr:hypothetical protein AVEN_62056-1 [Araneus ventricosus]
MARSRKETTISIRKLIIFHHSSGKSVRNVAKLVNLSHSTGQYVIKRFKEENRIENKVYEAIGDVPENSELPSNNEDYNSTDSQLLELPQRTRMFMLNP